MIASILIHAKVSSNQNGFIGNGENAQRMGLSNGFDPE
jgi:hypothetical protein